MKGPFNPSAQSPDTEVSKYHGNVLETGGSTGPTVGTAGMPDGPPGRIVVKIALDENSMRTSANPLPLIGPNEID